MAGRELELLRGSHSFSIVGMDGGRISRDTVLSTNIFPTNILRSGIQAVNISDIRIPSGCISGGDRIYICHSVVEGICILRKYRTNLQVRTRWGSVDYSVG